MGLNVGGEWAAAYLALMVQAVFHVLVFAMVISGRHFLRTEYHPVEQTRDEIIFYLIQYTRLLCGAVGLSITFMMFMVDTTLQNLKYIVLYYNAFILLPYGLILFYWLLMKYRERPGDWLDEKQFGDLSRAGLFTLVASIPVITVLYGVNFISPGTSMSVLWFPFYLHFAMVFFSGAMLYLREG